MSNSYPNSINSGASTTPSLTLKENQSEKQKKVYTKEDLKLLQQKFSNSINIPNPQQKQLYLLQLQQQQQLQQRQLQLQKKQFQKQQQQIMYNKMQNKRKTDREKMLDTYIYDYCLKRNYKQTAELLKQEAKISTEDIQQISSECFLYEWWTVFWEIYSAKENNEEDTTPDALTYINAQNQKSKQDELLLRQVNSLNTQKGVNTNSLTSQLLNPQLKQLQLQQLQQKNQPNSQSQQTQSSLSSQQPQTTPQLAVQQLQFKNQAKQTQTQTQSHSNSTSSILNSNQNHSASVNVSNSILPLSSAANAVSGPTASKNPQLSTSSSPQFNLNNTLTGLSSYTTQNLPNSTLTPLIQSIQPSQQPTQSPHLSTNPSPQLSQGILRNGASAATIPNASTLQNIGRSNANSLNLYAEALRNTANLPLQDNNQIQFLNVLKQMKQQQHQKTGLTQTTTANIPANLSVQNQKLGIATQINSTLSSTDSSQDITQPPTKRLRAANGVQYSPVITNNTMQSPVLTTQQQRI